MPSDVGSGSTSMVVLGVAGGLATAIVFGGVLGYVVGTKVRADRLAGWNLRPVVVAAVDLPRGELVTMEMISQRSLPEQFVTRSMVTPESASYILDLPLRAPAVAGDVLLWSSFEPTAADRACAALVGRLAARQAKPSEELSRLLDALQRVKPPGL